MSKVKLGIIGCGIAARELHLPALMKLKDKFEITVLCNHTEPKAREISEMLCGIPYVTEYKELLKRSDVDAVDIALPIELNYKVTKDALEAGKHVIVEKPLAASLKDAAKMLAFPEKYGLVTLVAENFRYRAVYLRIKELLKKGAIGKPYAALWDIYNCVSENNKFAQTKWRRHHKYPGGFMTDAGIHNIAALRYLFGEINAVNAFTKSINPKIGRTDTMSIQFETEGKVNGVFNLFFTVNGFWENELKILGTKGTIIVQDNKIIIKSLDKNDIEETCDDDGGYLMEFENFYNAITNGKKVFGTFEEGYRDLKVILNALKSAETGKRITL